MPSTTAHESRPNQDQPLSLLALTSLFPNPFQPGWALFNQRQIRALARFTRLGLVAPIPFRQAWPGLLGPARLDPEPFPVLRPWFLYLPGVKRSWQGRAFLASAWPGLRRLAGQLRPRVIYATWLFPDAWAGLMAARRLGLPLAVRLHGSDLLARAGRDERQPYLRQTLAGAQAVIAPSRSLLEAARDLGARPERLWLVSNGLDRNLFRPAKREEARRELGLPLGPLALFVGRLEPVKGPDLALEALAASPGINLVMVGEGSLAGNLRARARALGLAGRVAWAGGQPPARVARYLAACDALILPSRSEGEPNALLEALACGRPAAATAVGGVPDLIQDGVNGFLASPCDAPSLALALRRTLDGAWKPEVISAGVAGRSWEASAAELLKALQAAAALGAGA